MPMPLVTQPKSAAKPAAAPKAVVVVGKLRGIARLKDMNRARIKLIVNTLSILIAGGVSPNALARWQALPKRNGACQTAQEGCGDGGSRDCPGLSVCVFLAGPASRLVAQVDMRYVLAVMALMIVSLLRGGSG